MIFHIAYFEIKVAQKIFYGYLRMLHKKFSNNMLHTSGGRREGFWGFNSPKMNG
jgi:hypothetical protein